MMMIFESQIARYAFSLIAIAVGGSRLDWMFGDAVRSALWRSSLTLCEITGQVVCF